MQAHFITARTKSWEYLEGLKGVWRVLIQCVCYAKITARFLKVDLHVLLDCIFELIHQGVVRRLTVETTVAPFEAPCPNLEA